MSNLGPNQKTILARSSDLITQTSFQNLQSYFSSSEWLDINNRYRVDTVKNLEDDIANGTINCSDLVEYIAASAPLHCSDGWSFLGRALESHARGDRDCSRHFAYYAELRAAMSLLATNGIGIFDKRHIVVDSLSQCPHINGSTHSMAWDCLEEWADLNLSSSNFLVAELIQVNGKTLNDWLSAFSPVSTPQLSNLITKKWLETWGLDLRRLGKDRDFRNESSYRPNRLNRVPKINILTASDFVCEFWKLYEPSGQALFDSLDKHILRLSLEMWYESASGQKVTDDLTDFESKIFSMLKNLGISGPLEKAFRDFLMRRNEPSDPSIIDQARQTATATDPMHHLQVISRAALLLRIATAACSYLIKSSNLNPYDLQFWYDELGEERGIWESGKAPDDLIDLWEDISDSIKEIEDWKNSTSSASVSCAKWRRECAFPISVLGGCELIAMWGFGV
ncbi:MAG: hypothetical protein HC878_20240 [Leptolyngbyaceae cyanobacterium SL_5_14]|nr:hypothetical protein [Leptolyngbyaceae cyanobacterium SL_5_14]